MPMIGGIGHALASVADLLIAGHISAAIVTCNCEDEKVHQFSLVWNDEAESVMIESLNEVEGRVH